MVDHGGRRPGREEILEQAERAGLNLVRFLYCDNDGMIRGKATARSGLSHRLEAGIGLTVAMQAFTILDHLASFEGMGPVGEVRLVPDPKTFVVAPYLPSTGVLLVDMQTLTDAPYAADPRYFLKRMIDRGEERGLNVVASFEPEWTLVRKEGAEFLPYDQSPCFSSEGMNSAAAVIDELIASLQAQHLRVEQYYPELGWGQQELSIGHHPALHAADAQVLYRETVRGVVRNHGLYCSFAPKPWPDQAGNGCHLHFSALTGDDLAGAAFYDFEDGGLSILGRQFTAGVLEHLPGLLALTCASVNSYRRLQPQMWASAYSAWGPDNREAALRVPSPFRGQEEGSTNVELKACDSSCNPYLALGGLIAAGVDGLERQLELPPPVTVDPFTLSEEERAAARIVQHPGSLAEALDRLEQDSVLMDALGDRLSGSYLAVKRKDVADFAEQDEDFEFRQHRFKF
ncbi:glutamine synthetase family protein [Candidatus Nephthysia bennettiae]|uniref:glutamine synthetase family protein n=1 Tax=Candidatus Nephthysia bennettiae TaxID=3127016 RepID=UPI0030C75C49